MILCVVLVLCIVCVFVCVCCRPKKARSFHQSDFQASLDKLAQHQVSERCDSVSDVLTMMRCRRVEGNTALHVRRTYHVVVVVVVVVWSPSHHPINIAVLLRCRLSPRLKLPLSIETKARSQSVSAGLVRFIVIASGLISCYLCSQSDVSQQINETSATR